MRVGLVGCGFIGTVHSFALRQLSRAGLIDASVTATYDADPARAEAAAAAHDTAVAVPDVGTLIDHSIHDVDVLSRVLGEPESVSARTACRFGHAGIEDVADVTLTYAGGAITTLMSVWHQVTSRPSTRRLEVFCQDALLWTD